METENEAGRSCSRQPLSRTPQKTPHQGVGNGDGNTKAYNRRHNEAPPRQAKGPQPGRKSARPPCDFSTQAKATPERGKTDPGAPEAPSPPRARTPSLATLGPAAPLRRLLTRNHPDSSRRGGNARSPRTGISGAGPAWAHRSGPALLLRAAGQSSNLSPWQSGCSPAGTHPFVPPPAAASARPPARAQRWGCGGRARETLKRAAPTRTQARGARRAHTRAASPRSPWRAASRPSPHRELQSPAAAGGPRGRAFRGPRPHRLPPRAGQMVRSAARAGAAGPARSASGPASAASLESRALAGSSPAGPGGAAWTARRDAVWRGPQSRAQAAFHFSSEEKN